MSERRLRSVVIDPASLAAANRDAEHEREVAIFDLLEQNAFFPLGAPEGPYDLRLSMEEGRLVFDIGADGGADGPFQRRHILSLTPIRSVIKDYFMICDSYYAAIRNATPQQIETLDMGRRGLHNEGSVRLQERLAGKIEVDHTTARRLFTLICALHFRG